MIRRTTEDMVFTTDDPHFAPQGGRIPVEKGTTLIVDMVGMRTPLYFSLDECDLVLMHHIRQIITNDTSLTQRSFVLLGGTTSRRTI